MLRKSIIRKIDIRLKKLKNFIIVIIKTWNINKKT